jgi:hypothetical protein
MRLLWPYRDASNSTAVDPMVATGQSTASRTTATTAPAGLGRSPPRPTLTLRVGITGHRPKSGKLPESSFGFVQARLREVFGAIDAALVEIARGQSANYLDAPHKVRLVSALAEGADQLAVSARPSGWTVDAILPFPRESYLDDFRQSAAGDGRDVTAEFLARLAEATTVVELPDDPLIRRKELRPETSPDEYQRRRNAGYTRLGGFLLRQVDLLVAVWDGLPEGGEGGTADVVRAAAEAEIPVVWVHSLQDGFSRMIEETDDEGRPRAPDADCCDGPLREALEFIVCVPSNSAAPAPGENRPSASERLASFLVESWPGPSRWITYDFFKRRIEGKPTRRTIPAETEDGHMGRWEPFGRDGPDAGDLPRRVAEILRPRYAWADALAVDYSHRYRTAYFDTYLLGAAAVLIALTSLFLRELIPVLPWQLLLKAALVILELFVIWRIVGLVRTGRRGRWHEKWLEYRTLAELLFNARFLAYLGEHGRAHHLGNLEPASSAWFLWYLRATIREIGLPDARLEGTYQRVLLDAMDQHVIADEIAWHRDNATTLHRMHAFLHGLGDGCFAWTARVLIGFLALWLIWMALSACNWAANLLAPAGGSSATADGLRAFAASWQPPIDHWLQWLKDVVTFFAAFLPAAAAALAGIRETGDFRKVSARSTKTTAALLELQQEAARARTNLALAQTGDILLSTARVLTEDLAAWQSVYGQKRLELPA